VPTREPPNLRSEVVCKSIWSLKPQGHGVLRGINRPRRCRIFTFTFVSHPACDRQEVCYFSISNLPPKQTNKPTNTTTSTIKLYKMCLSCGCWPWDNAVHVQVADAPTKDEYIFLGANHSFYPDHRVVSEDSHRAFPPLRARTPSPNTTSST
jgi:hypothetical protein